MGIVCCMMISGIKTINPENVLVLRIYMCLSDGFSLIKPLPELPEVKFRYSFLAIIKRIEKAHLMEV